MIAVRFLTGSSRLLLAALLSTPVGMSAPEAFAQSAPADNMSAVRYDIARRVTGTIAPDPDGAGPIRFAATRNSYDARGSLTKVEGGELLNWQPEGTAPEAWPNFTVFRVVETSYDIMGRKTKDVVTAGGIVQAVTQYSYTAAGDLECSAVRMNASTFPSLPASACSLGPVGAQGSDRITRNVYTVPGRVQKVQQAYGTPKQRDYVSYTYLESGKPRTLTDANGATTTYDYDGFERLKRWRFPSKLTAGVSSDTDYEEYGYDAGGRRTSLRKRDGSVFAYQYDILGRVTAKIVPERTGLPATHSRDVYYGYDLRGLQLYARFDSASGEGVAFTYDNHGRQTSSTQVMDGATRTLAYQWDDNSLRTRVTHDDGNYAQYGYDGLDRLLTIHNGSTLLLSQNYNAKVEVTGRSLAGGITSSLTYDALSRPIVMSHDLAGSTGDINFGYGYNSAGQMVTRSRSNDAYIYGGDVNVARSYAVNALGQYLTTSTGATFCYDANGNLIFDGTRVYLYDNENRLVESRTAQILTCPTPASGYSGIVKAALRYDPLGRLYETDGGSAGVTRFLYDGDELVGEYNTAGTPLRRYVHGVGSDDPVAWYEGATMSADRRMLLTDHQGSLIASADSGGAAVALNRYDEWGVPDATNSGRFQYTGQAWIPELGMYHYKARTYSPTLGRFMQTDPIGYDDNKNLYAYVGNDPVNARDPTGEYRCPTDKDCAAAEKGIGELRDAKRFYASMGYLSTQNAIGRILDTLGDKNEGFKGEVTIKVGVVNTDPSARGGYDPVSNVITLNTSRIAELGTRVGESLGHETVHYRQREAILTGRLKDLPSEVRPLMMQYIIGRAPGGSITGGTALQYVKERLKGYCEALCDKAIPAAIDQEWSKPF